MNIEFLKKLVLRVSPQLYYAILSYRFFRRCKERFETSQNDLENRMFPNRNITVQSGPFSGLRYYNKIIWGALTPKWMGCYEMELDPVILGLIEGDYPLIIDIGAAEGYYAVGLAWRLPKARIIAYDIDPIARFRQKQLAAMNDIRNLEIRQLCSHAELEKVFACHPGRKAIICDIEGGEADLLDPSSCAILRTCDILVELHKSGRYTDAEIKELMIRRFSESHTIRQIGQEPRDAAALRERIPVMAGLPDEIMLRAADECRYPSQGWLWMTPNSLTEAPTQ